MRVPLVKPVLLVVAVLLVEMDVMGEVALQVVQVPQV
jgi:hypothetical protein